MAVPDYRLRLFLSADIAGSTAFKANSSQHTLDAGVLSPAWVVIFQEFYTNFPSLVRTEYLSDLAQDVGDDEKSRYPRLWKTLGDEVVLVGVISNVEHCAHVVTAFLRALAKYSKILDEKGVGLAIKGSAWLAAFPTPNTTVPLRKELPANDDIDAYEEIELEADAKPADFDFLGKAIDTGFRIGSRATTSKCPISVQLAHILACAKDRQRFSHDVWYGGREVLKGVNKEIPYPIFYLDTETNDDLKKLRSRERSLTGASGVDVAATLDFLDQFMKVAQIEPGYIENLDATHRQPRPKSYTDYCAAYAKAVEDIKKQNEELDAGAKATGDERTPSVEDWFELLKQVQEKFTDLP